MFDSKKKFEAHVIFSHKIATTSKKKILILGGGFGGMHILKELQKKLDVKNTRITIVSENNYFLFTPMIPEATSGMLNPRDITTPIREFCTSAKFYQATVFSVDLEQKFDNYKKIWWEESCFRVWLFGISGRKHQQFFLEINQ